MKLRDYLKSTSTKPETFGRRIGLSPWQNIYRYLREPGAKGFQRPSAPYMTRIYIATGGAVTPSDFYTLPQLSAAQRATGVLPLASPAASRSGSATA